MQIVKLSYLPYYMLLTLLGCVATPAPKDAIDWNSLNYTKTICGDWKTHDPNCSSHDSDITAIGKGGKR